MSITTNGQICFGVMFEEDDELPWNNEENDYNLETWWFNEVCSRKPPPVEEVNYCSFDEPMYILAVPRTCIYSNRGYPEKINPEDLIVSQEEKQALLDFCNKYCPSKEKYEPKWYLSSYYG